MLGLPLVRARLACFGSGGGTSAANVRLLACCTCRLLKAVCVPWGWLSDRPARAKTTQRIKNAGASAPQHRALASKHNSICAQQHNTVRHHTDTLAPVPASSSPPGRH